MVRRPQRGSGPPRRHLGRWARGRPRPVHSGRQRKRGGRLRRNPAKFGHIARRITARKPVIAVKSGRSAAGQRAASSHTGALLAAADTTVDALFRHAGVISYRHRRRDVPSGCGAQPPAAATGQSGGHRDQCGRPGDPLRRRL
ncbi:MAG: hypothetical protein ABWY65_05735 [Thermoleophilaceae bacterium]